MTTNIATTREQSARLLQCGVDPETADMFYQTPITVSQKRQGEDILLLKRPGKTLYNIDTPAWSLSALLAIIPSVIYAPDISDVPDGISLEDEANGNWVAPLCEYQWEMWSNPGRSFEFEGERTETPPVYGMKYTSICFLPPTHPIAPNSPMTLFLYDEDGNRVAWTDANPIEVCVQAIEWLTANNYKLNQL